MHRLALYFLPQSPQWHAYYLTELYVPCLLKGRGKKKQAGNAPVAKKGAVAKQPVKTKGFSDDNASWLKPAQGLKAPDSDTDGFSDGDILDDEFDPEVDLDQLGKDVSDGDLSEDDVSGDEEDDETAQVRPGISLAVTERISIISVACATQPHLHLQEEAEKDKGNTRKAQVPQLMTSCSCYCNQALQPL